MAMPMQAFARETATVEIPFTVKNGSGTVVIEAVGGAPLPEQTEFVGVSEGKLTAKYTEPGDYCYRIYQRPGTEKGITYDSTVYEICVSVFVKEDGTLYSVVACNEEGSPQKTDEVVFENIPERTKPEFPEEQKTGETGRICPLDGDDGGIAFVRHLLLYGAKKDGVSHLR